MQRGDRGAAKARPAKRPKPRYVAGVTDFPQTGGAHALAKAVAAHRQQIRVHEFQIRRAKALRQVQLDTLHGKITPFQAHERLQAMGFSPGGALAMGRPELITNALHQAPHLPAQVGAFLLQAGKGAAIDVGHPVRTGKALGHDLYHFDALDPHSHFPELEKHSRLYRDTIIPTAQQLAYMASGGPVIIGQDAKGPIYRGKDGHPTRDVNQARHGIGEKMVERPLDYALLATGARTGAAGGVAKVGRALEHRGVLAGDRFSRALEPGQFTYRTRTGQEATIRTSTNPARRSSQERRRTAVVKVSALAERIANRELAVGEHARATRLLARGQRRANFADQQRALGPFDRAFRKLKPHESLAVVLRAVGGNGPRAVKPSELLGFIRARQAEDATLLERISTELEQQPLSRQARATLEAQQRQLRGALKDHERVMRYVAKVPDELHAAVDTTPHLRAALEEARRLSTAGGDILERAGKLSPVDRALRPYLTARIARGARFQEIRPSAPLVQARRHEAALERAVETATQRRDRELQKLIGRMTARERVPHTEESAAVRLGHLAGQHERYVQGIERTLSSTPIAKERAHALLAEHDAKIAAAEAHVEAVRAHAGDISAASGEAARSHPHAPDVRAARAGAAGIRAAEKAVARLRRERKQFADAVETGRLVTRADPAETARRNAMRARGQTTLPTLAEDLRQEAITRLEGMIARNPNHPTWQRYHAIVAEIERLRSGLTRLREERMAGRNLTPQERAQLLGHQETPAPRVMGRSLVTKLGGGIVTARGQANLDRLSSALSVSRDRRQALERQHVDRFGVAPDAAQSGFVGGPEIQGLVHDLGDVIFFPHRGAKLREGAAPQAQAGRVPPRVPDAAKMNQGVRMLASRWLPSPAAWRDTFVQALGYSHALARGELAYRVGDRVGPNGERHEGWYYVRRGPAKPSRAASERTALERQASEFLNESDPDLEGFVRDSVSSRESATFRRWLNDGTPLEEIRQISPADQRRLFGEFRPASEFIRRFYDRPTDFWRALTLTYRPAWVVNNLVGQTLLFALNHAGHGAAKAYASAVLDEARGKQGRYFPEELKGGFIRSESSSGGVLRPAGVGRIDTIRDVRSVGGALRALAHVEARIRQRIQDFNALTSDNIPRRAAWYRVVDENRPWLNRQLGAHHTFEELLAELRAAAEEMAGGDRAAPLRREARLRELHDELVQQVHNQLVDFNDLNPFERRVMRRFIPFYSWVKGITKALGLFSYHHPLKTLLLLEGARGSQDELGRAFGPGAAILENVVPFGRAVDRGHGPEQDVLTTTGLNPLQTVADVFGKTEGTFRRNPESPADNPILLANPIIQAVGEALFRKDAFRGSDLSARGGAAGILAGQLATAFPEVVAGERLLTPQHPTTAKGNPHLTVPGATLAGIPYEVWNLLGLPIKRKNLAAATSIANLRGGGPEPGTAEFRKELAESQRFAKAHNINGGRIPPEILRQLVWKRDLALAKAQEKKKLRVAKLPAKRAAELTAQSFIRLHPDAQAKVMADLAKLPPIDDAYASFVRDLESDALAELRDWDTEKRDWLRSQELAAVGAG